MKYQNGDLLESNVDVMMHVANVYHTFGSGIAYTIRHKFPEAYKADCETEYGCDSKLGTFSKAEIAPNRYICNLYAMHGIGNSGNPLDRNCSYDSLYNAIYKACQELIPKYDKPVVIGIPYLMGCCRAGGSWLIVDSILACIEDEFPDKVSFTIFRLENGETKAKSTQPK